jgi:hypothetical protein
MNLYNELRKTLNVSNYIGIRGLGLQNMKIKYGKVEEYEVLTSLYSHSQALYYTNFFTKLGGVGERMSINSHKQ